MKELYYDFVNLIQEMPALWFATIWLVGFAVVLMLIVKFYKAYNGTQKNFEKLGTFIIAIVLIAALIFLTYIRK